MSPTDVGAPRPDLSIRRAREDDLPAVMRLVGACIEDMQRRGIDQWDEVYPALDRFRADVQAGTLQLAFHTRRLLGLFTLNEFQDFEYEEVPWAFTDGPVAVVHRLMVSPDVQGQGVAKSLMAAAERLAADGGFAIIRLDAFGSNPRALQLYRGLGYHEAGEVEFRKGAFRCFEKRIAK